MVEMRKWRRRRRRRRNKTRQRKARARPYTSSVAFKTTTNNNSNIENSDDSTGDKQQQQQQQQPFLRPIWDEFSLRLISLSDGKDMGTITTTKVFRKDLWQILSESMGANMLRTSQTTVLMSWIWRLERYNDNRISKIKNRLLLLVPRMLWIMMYCLILVQPVVHSFSSWSPRSHRTSQTMRQLSLSQQQQEQPRKEKTVSVGIYIHIPFCRRRCRYVSILKRGKAKVE